MVMLTAYFDETGHEKDLNSRICGMAGCVAPVKVWERFEVKWRKRLEEAGIAYFHMKEFAHCTGPFAKGWKDDEPKRQRLYGDLWEIIAEVNPYFHGSFVPLDQYRQVLAGLTEAQQQSLVDSYFLTYQSCMAAVFNLLLKPDGHRIRRIVTVFDQKKDFVKHVHGFYQFMCAQSDWQERVPPPVFDDMRVLVPLQVADIVAYECQKEFGRRLNRPNGKVRWGFTRLEGLIRAMTPHLDFQLGDVNTPIIFHGAEMMHGIKLSFDETPGSKLRDCTDDPLT